MFCSFEDKPLILRLYDRGEIVSARDSRWQKLLTHFDDLPGSRQMILFYIESVQTSCGFGVPLYEYRGQRETLRQWGEKKGAEGVRAYQRKNNRTSIDRLPTGWCD